MSVMPRPQSNLPPTMSTPAPGVVSQGTDTLLDVRDLSVDFLTVRGKVHALRNVNVRVPKGKVVGIVGESGSGKSTLVWAIMQLLAGNGEITSGSVIFRDRDLLATSPAAMRDLRGEEIAMVFQDPMTAQIPVLSYKRQMVDVLYRRQGLSTSDKVELATRLVHRVGIPDASERIRLYPHQFSGGMRQRASIAMALLTDPGLLIADEPTTALDVTMEAQIIHLIREVQAEHGCSVMVVSHNLGLIAELCDEVVVMYAGEVIEHGDVESIFFESRHPYTQALLECDPSHDLTRSRVFPTIQGDVPDLHQTPSGCVFAPRCPHAGDVCRMESPKQIEVPPRAGRGSPGLHAVRCHLHDPASQLTSRDAEDRARAQGPTPAAGTDAESAVEPVLDVSDLRVRFRIMNRVRALATRTRDPFVDAVIGASLSVRAGETLGLVGESGSGKTTLGRAVIGLNQIHSGDVRFEGENLTGLSQAEYRRRRRHIGMMFQDPVGSLSPRRTVAQLLSEPLIVHGESSRNGTVNDEVDRLCDMVSLPRNFLSRYPHELSGGQARRVGVARALALRPKLIIADEPTAGLDVSVQGEILNLLMNMQSAHNLACLVISHNLPVIRQISDVLAIMYLGRIVEIGPCSRVFDAPGHPYSEALVRGAPQPDPTKRRQLVSIEGEVPSLTNRPSGCEFHPRCPHARELCRNVAPVPQRLSDGRAVSCHFPLVS